MFIIDPKTGLSYTLEDVFTIGRHPSCNINLADTKVSRKHAKIYRRHNRCFIEDLGSRNGTFVNGKRISRSVELCDGFEIKIGSAIFVFRMPQGASTELPPTFSDDDPSESVTIGHNELDPATYDLKDEASTVSDPGDSAKLRGRLDRITEISCAIRNIHETNQIESEAVRHTLEAFPNAKRCVMVIRNEAHSDLVIRAFKSRPEFESSRIKISRTVIKEVLTGRKATLCANPWTEAPYSEAESIQTHEIHSFMCAPIFVHDRADRAIYLDSIDEESVFSNDDLTLLVLVANQIASSLEYAQLIEELSRERTSLEENNVRLREQDGREYDFSQIIGTSRALKKTIERAKKAADSDVSVLITGDNGTGKELFARAIHYNSTRADKPVVFVNCAAIADSLISSELFGHVKGAFTGADKERKGHFETAHGGTIVLDEIGDMPLEAQAEVLRVLESGEIMRVGSSETTTVDVRVIACTNKDLKKEIEAGRFRQDLYYRLNVYPIHIPPLADRKEDILPLANHFLSYFCHHMNKKAKKGFTRSAVEILRNYNWPGNVRELKNTIERAVLELDDGDAVDEKHLPAEVRQADSVAKYKRIGKLPDAVARLEKDMILDALAQSNGNKAEAARILGLSRMGLHNKLKRYDLE